MNRSRTIPLSAATLASLAVFISPFLIGCAGPAARPTPSGTLLTGADPSAARLVDYLRSQRVPVIAATADESRIEAGPDCRAALIRFMGLARLRMETCAANIANVNTTRDAEGSSTPYRRRIIVLTSAGAADTRLDESPFAERFEPGHPDANARGFVRYPNVDLDIEYLTAQEAAQDYETAAAVLRRLDPTIVIVLSPGSETRPVNCRKPSFGSP